MCIMAIDDDPDELFLLGMICRRAGYKGDLQRFECEADALAYAGAHPPPDVILCDLNLPMGTAWDLLPKIWALAGYANTPVFVYTGLVPMDAERRMAALPNLRAVLEKPVSEDIVRNLLLPLCRTSLSSAS